MSNWDDTITGLLGLIDLAEANIRVLDDALASAKEQKAEAQGQIEDARLELMAMLLESGVLAEKHPKADLLIKDGPIKVVAHPDADPEDLPIDLVRIKRTPDMGAIKKALVRGDQVPGYHLEAGPQQLQIKRQNK